MTQDKTPDPGQPPDATDVVEGPVGSASLKDPARPGTTGADLERLTPIDDVPGDATGEDG